MLLIGVASGVAQLITFVDWAIVKKKGKKQKELLDHSFKTLEKLEVNLKQIQTVLEEKKGPSEIRNYVDLLSEAKAELIRDLFEMGIEVPKEEPPKVKEASDKELLGMLSLCEREIIRAQGAISATSLGFVRARHRLAMMSKRKMFVMTFVFWGLFIVLLYVSATRSSVFPLVLFSLLLASFFTLLSVFVFMRPW